MSVGVGDSDEEAMGEEKATAKATETVMEAVAAVEGDGRVGTETSSRVDFSLLFFFYLFLLKIFFLPFF